MKARIASAWPSGVVFGLAAVYAVTAGAALGATPASPTFEQVLQAPDDIAINLAFAQNEVAAGNLLSAAAALERVLIAHPDAHAVRLFHAIVLYRLDDLQGAGEQLRLLANAPLPRLQAAERDRYSRLLESRRSPNKFGGRLAVGFDYGSDVSGALASRFDIPGAVLHRAGESIAVSGALNGSVLLDPLTNVSAYGALSGYSRPDNFGHDNSLESGEALVGLSGAGPTTAWKLGGALRHYAILHSPYLTEFGGQAEASWSPDTAATFTGHFEAVRQIFHEPLVDALAGLGALNGTHDGWRYDARLDAAYRFSAQSLLVASAGYEWKTASYRPFAYEAPYLQGDFRNLFTRGVYIDLLASVRFYEYRAADSVFLGPVPGVKRKSTLSEIRAVLGVPLSALTQEGITGDPLEDMTLEAGIGYRKRTEKSRPAEFDDVGASLRLVWRFGQDS